MLKDDRDPCRTCLTRREFGTLSAKSLLFASVAHFPAASAAGQRAPIRSINIMNFIRAEEPREPVDLMAPVAGQMALIKQYRFPATWLLQYDAMVEGPYAAFLKSQMPADHETGIWFEMNRKTLPTTRALHGAAILSGSGTITCPWPIPSATNQKNAAASSIPP